MAEENWTIFLGEGNKVKSVSRNFEGKKVGRCVIINHKWWMFLGYEGCVRREDISWRCFQP